jgi:hypothetical protein
MTRRAYIIPAVIAALAAAGLAGANYISVPTLTHVFEPDFEGETARAELIVEGVRCHGMADFLREHIESLPGLVSMVAYAGKHRVIIEYSPERISLDGIVAAINEPSDTDEGRVRYFEVVSRKDL